MGGVVWNGAGFSHRQLSKKFQMQQYDMAAEVQWLIHHSADLEPRIEDLPRMRRARMVTS